MMPYFINETALPDHDTRHIITDFSARTLGLLGSSYMDSEDRKWFEATDEGWDDDVKWAEEYAYWKTPRQRVGQSEKQWEEEWGQHMIDGMEYLLNRELGFTVPRQLPPRDQRFR